MIVTKIKKAGICLLPFTFSLALTGCINTKPTSEQSATRSAVAPADEHFISLNTYRAQSEQTIQDLGLSHTDIESPGTEWRSWDNPSLPEFNLWDRLLQSFKLDLEIDNPRIAAQLNWYKRHPHYLERVFTRAERYMFHVVKEVEARNLPGELALLPIVESAYDPFAYSHGRASGMWQFIPSTARYFGIKNDWWYDGRRDVLDSTDAALTYLDRLARRFDGDWMHALAAYNSGGGTVNKAIRKNREAGKPTHYWALRLPAETKAYVPKLIALAKLVKHAEEYGIKLRHIPNEPYFAAVNTEAQIDLAQAAKMADITINELYLLNPGYSQWATSPNGPHRLLVPVENTDTFKENLSKVPPQKRIAWQRYKVESGDSLISIAKRFRTTPALIRDANQIRGNSIRAGSRLLIPIPKANASHYALSSSQRLKRKQSYDRSNTGGNKIVHYVQSGDSFWLLSRKHKVSIRELARWNGMAPNDPLMPGKKLVIWSKADQAVSNDAKNRKIIRRVGYKVRRGDSLARIAGKFNVSVNQIVSWNKIDKRKYLQPGQSLTLYVDVTRSH
ncbi:LysM peptidoglycan-binding domain-containing protein [Oceanospirillum linum]|uniref:Lytic transglycosylase n=1 Tax=Oceanospirillum linum TaxID=966 RepID=A0A1T1HCV6_OCELI|nr:LysM peptidoglycan-binding domain-containing protein [Oceanospirillum linum]OOV87642.1 lytic transglycosylase [Oceanospirillum linum]SEF94845.1 membrane-bound lytic murein transglycosylase D [Oleiphilus messinensis]SMP11792.1 membrane-bound lytic murein transglycosylase D [Oceanospirillum linum]